MRRASIAAGVLALIAAPVLLWWLLAPGDVVSLTTPAATSSPAPKRTALSPSAVDASVQLAEEGLDAGVAAYGVVVDENGDPVPGAHVRFDYTDHEADDAGRYAVDSSEPAVLHVVAFDAAHGIGLADGTTDAPPTVKLSPLGAARVRVTVGGKPAKEAEVVICQQRDAAGKPSQKEPPCGVTLVTGADGVVSCKGLEAGEWAIGASAPEAGEVASVTVTLDGKGAREINFELREARRFEGIVTDANGKPIHCARVSDIERTARSRLAGAVGYVESGDGYAFTDEKGHFVLRLEPDRTTANLTVEHKGFEVLEEQLDQSSDLRLRMKPFPHYLGLVVGPGDQPLDEFWVNGRHFKGGHFEVAVERPDEDGKIPIDINASGFRYLSESRLARPDLGVFHLEPLAVISGAVFASDGGIVGAKVSVVPGQPWSSADDGHFTLEVDPADIPADSLVAVRAVAGDECVEKTIDLAHAEGLVLRLAPGDCPSAEAAMEDYAGPPPEAFAPECDDDDD